jgi:glycosyltransferase involved in cell wall biosynthesis
VTTPARRPRVVLLRGHSANPWELRTWEELADRFDVSVLVTGGNRYDLSSLRLECRPVRTLRDRLPPGRAGDLAATAAGDRYVDLERHLAGADVVHSAELGVWFSRQPALLRRRLGFRLVLTVWETIPFRSTYRAFRGRAYRAETIPEVDLFLAATERARAGLLLEDVPAERIEVAPPGVDVERFRAARREPAAEPLVVSPGRLVWEKGHQDVLRAAAALERGLVGEPLRVRVLIVGAGPEERRLRRYADDLGLGERVEFRSVPYEAMPDVFGAASVVVLASLPIPLWEEQFGMVLAEALAAGAPVVASTSGAIPEVVGHGATLVAPGDWAGIAAAVRDAPAEARHPELVERYSLRAAADRLAAAYDRVLAR